jgi:hypothetical protein
MTATPTKQDDFNSRMDALSSANADGLAIATDLANSVLAAQGLNQTDIATLQSISGGPDTQVGGIAKRLLVTSSKLTTSANAALAAVADSGKAFEVSLAAVHTIPDAAAPAPAAHWVAKSVVPANSSVVLPNGTVVFSTAGGTTGSFPPTGPGTDGSVTWVLPTAAPVAKAA